MPLTYTDRNVKLENQEHPSLMDIAVGLSRMPRFAGQTQRWWSVLDHTLFGDHIIRVWDQGGRDVRLAWLLHDAHEALTGDVPTPFKSAGLRMTQAELDQRIYAAHGYNAAQEFEYIKEIDQRVVVAEAWEIGPPATAQELEEAFPELPNTRQDRESLKFLLSLRKDTFGVPPLVSHQEKHPAVELYLRLFAELQ